MSEKKAKSFDNLYRRAEAHDDYWIADAVQGFTEEVFLLMEQKKITRADLARRIGTSPAYVTKILRGNANFTLATMVKLARALEVELRIELTPGVDSDRDSAESFSTPSSGRGTLAPERMAARPAS